MTAIKKNGEIEKDEINPLSDQVLDATVYVDGLFVFESRDLQAQRAGQSNGHRWCHMWSDDVRSLHDMAAKIGMRPEWFQDKHGFPHYDLPPVRRAAALSFGAVEHSLKDWLRARKTQKVSFVTFSLMLALLPY